MNKDEFIRQIKKKIKRLPKDEIDQAIQYYTEYIDDSEKSEEETIKGLGSPNTIASQILANSAINNPNKKGFFSNSVLIILSILAAPIGLPLALLGIILLITFLIVLGVLAFSAIIVIISLLIAGVSVFFYGILIALKTPAVAAYNIGCSFILLGIGSFLCSIFQVYWPKIKLCSETIFLKVLSKINK